MGLKLPVTKMVLRACNGLTAGAVLVLDDDVTTRGLIADFLRLTHGLDVVEAATNHESLALLRVRKISLIVEDIFHPGPNGIDLLRELKSDTRTCNIPVIVASGQAGAHESAAIRLGAKAVFKKPFDLKEFGDVVMKTLGIQETPDRERHLLENLRAGREGLARLLEDMQGHSGYEDKIYRAYYGSFKTQALHELTLRMVEALRGLAPESRGFHHMFEAILADSARAAGALMEEPDRWISNARVLAEGFFHAKYFLEMAVKYAAAFDSPPQSLPSGYAALLCLYGLR